MTNLPDSRDYTLNPGDPVPSPLLNTLQDMIIGSRRPVIPRRILPGVITWSGTQPTQVLNPNATNGTSPVWKIPTAQNVNFFLPFDVGDTISDIAIDVWGDAAVRITCSTFYSTSLSVAPTNIISMPITAALPASWQTFTFSVSGTATPQVLASGSVLTFQLVAVAGAFVHLGAITMFMSR